MPLHYYEADQETIDLLIQVQETSNIDGIVQQVINQNRDFGPQAKSISVANVLDLFNKSRRLVSQLYKLKPFMSVVRLSSTLIRVLP